MGSPRKRRIVRQNMRNKKQQQSKKQQPLSPKYPPSSFVWSETILEDMVNSWCPPGRNLRKILHERRDR